MATAKADAEVWELRAIRIAAALDTATDELARLIADIRNQRNHREEADDDARPGH